MKTVNKLTSLCATGLLSPKKRDTTCPAWDITMLIQKAGRPVKIGTSGNAGEQPTEATYF